ncbi:PREDICTED: LOC110769588 isoform [Prunus dulcis]|uniref:PREDICTED: LOC110769588 isoform n=1 Tax=Prunus dulcis TaxID=3755 RepID=A0A5E4FLX0_PRUDU|nr:uncharacterized protein LOC117620138 [Prunus dulcis]XP_034206150.1 uncharacterized protein LOC117620138 [Prunus dulcis]XP_034206151.1 uncharacterized protein LOC117620138 [Prunus dulcis]VVA28905.1 PREDICTED: LOC110769588 isoform [Prunus dulcis]
MEPEPIVPTITGHADSSRLVELVRELRELGAKPFYGTRSYMRADEWFGNIENLFEIMECSEVEKKELAVFLLQGKARYWWAEVKRAEDVSLMDWEGFKTVFYAKYFPGKDRLEASFLSLEQGSMSVGDYEAKFSRLLHFAQPMTEVQKARKFELGLVDDIRSSVVNLRLQTLTEVVDCAIAVERTIELYIQHQNRQRDYRGKGKALAQCMCASGEHGGTGKRQRTGNQKEGRAAMHAQQTRTSECYNCSEVGHLCRDCPKPKAHCCFKCKQPGHLAKHCTRG